MKRFMVLCLLIIVIPLVISTNLVCAADKVAGVHTPLKKWTVGNKDYYQYNTYTRVVIHNKWGYETVKYINMDITKKLKAEHEATNRMKEVGEYCEKRFRRCESQCREGTEITRWNGFMPKVPMGCGDIVVDGVVYRGDAAKKIKRDIIRRDGTLMKDLPKWQIDAAERAKHARSLKQDEIPSCVNTCRERWRRCVGYE